MPPHLLREGRAMSKMTSICKRHSMEARRECESWSQEEELGLVLDL